MNGEETTLQDSQPRPRKLTLTRETLRSLGDATLERAAGGTYEEPTLYACDPFMTSGSAI
jgi:hypothetical protein